DVEWMDGLDLLGPLGLKLAIIPHWNNAEGGTFDTRHCYMGAPRLKILEEKLAYDVVILGIDEHTACTLDPNLRTVAVNGAGALTLRYRGEEKIFPAGSEFSFDVLRASAFSSAPRAKSQPRELMKLESDAPHPPQFVATQLYLIHLARALQDAREVNAHRELIDHAHDAMHELAHEWRGADQLNAPDIAPFVELVIQTRAQLRAAKQFALADQLRDELSARGIALEDTARGTLWRRISL
ncbi:MAG: hypothetical protein HY257_02490, partial [Chloroflexi bacterium]|nr:hypothetical protein [Chloroflexota bacterium]